MHFFRQQRFDQPFSKCCLKQLSLFLASAWSNVWNAFILCGHHAHEHDDDEHVKNDNKNLFG